jgi:nucleotide sugar dehydrogenase|tara:strand:+ start:16181 stop:17017 length:837 start_codon:yes stop_codon:yes gene_type:complete
MNIGIIGQGFVGNAIYQKFKNYYDVYTYDLQAKLCNSTLEIINENCNIIFVCLPTPMDKDGRCHIGIVEEALSDLEILASIDQSEKIVIIKSTIPPGTTKGWDKCFTFLDIVFSPEFLTEANAVSDFDNQTRIILGGNKIPTTKLKPLFAKVFPKATIIKTDSTYAEMVKYVTNSFLATKVSFANEMYEICKGLNVDYDKVVEYACYDERLGKSHWAVPGPDGNFGYGGHCFPKDVQALINVAKDLKINPRMLEATNEKNFDTRIDRDWESMKGRAVI